MPYTTSVRIETYRRRARRRRAVAALLERGRFDPVAALRPQVRAALPAR